MQNAKLYHHAQTIPLGQSYEKDKPLSSSRLDELDTSKMRLEREREIKEREKDRIREEKFQMQVKVKDRISLSNNNFSHANFISNMQMKVREEISDNGDSIY